MSPIPVVIAGGGTVGLATAVFLGHHGVPSLVLERREEPSVHPRALGISPRSLEFFREVGLSERIDAAAVHSAVAWKADARTAAEIDWSRRPATPTPAGPAGLSPVVARGHYPQDRLDAVLAPAARELGATIEYGVAVTGVEQDDEGVSVTLSDGRVLRTRYLVGADGVRSAVREALGIPTTGPGEIGAPTLNILFHADLASRFGAMPAMTEIRHPDAPGMLLAVGEDRWVFHTGYSTEEDREPERCAQVIRTALGADLPVEIVSVLPWRATVRLARRFRAGRAFLVGDAARAVSPLGAFGLNTGLADAHNLAWKLAMVLAGQAGERLLESYHEERHAVAELVTRQALLRWENPRLHWDPTAVAERAAAGAWHASLVIQGYRYDSSAIAGPVAPLPSTEDLAAVLDGSPGSRLAHRWVEADGARVSTLDLNASRFAVLAGPDGQDWYDAAGKVSVERGLEVRAVRLDAAWAASAGIGTAGAMLVRPDGFVAWRSPGPVADPAAALGGVLATVTGKP
ncbi:FAD-dependent monooxygenase [Amycolatopsis cynarae]|uniref:FAD-dependent monooxygenase n=1 Tax=Amycolatopsis cynarae TaxID=2995223 RepID=A0ABY7AUY9_9PSEU|nr:FAD-dependent monooxygenase [Amycolatopsis sp. HUAS 11-8]WAL63741.1 FAD-dependent monooxygenase [Amycolatopsis sp. HUAS 11-8]